MQVELPANLDAVYSNLVIIQHSPSEFVLDFARVLPNMPAARVGTRVVMTPMHAKLLLRALQENIERFEAQFGPTTCPNKARRWPTSSSTAVSLRRTSAPPRFRKQNLTAETRSAQREPKKSAPSAPPQSGAFMDRGRTLWAGDGTAVAHPL